MVGIGGALPMFIEQPSVNELFLDSAHASPKSSSWATAARSQNLLSKGLGGGSSVAKNTSKKVAVSSCQRGNRQFLLMLPAILSWENYFCIGLDLRVILCEVRHYLSSVLARLHFPRADQVTYCDIVFRLTLFWKIQHPRLIQPFPEIPRLWLLSEVNILQLLRPQKDSDLDGEVRWAASTFQRLIRDLGNPPGRHPAKRDEIGGARGYGIETSENLRPKFPRLKRDPERSKKDIRNQGDSNGLHGLFVSFRKRTTAAR